MKVLHVVTVSGSLFFLRGQAEYFREHGVELAVICSPDANLETFGKFESMRTLAVPMARKISPISDIVSVWRLVRVLRAERPDIVHAHTPKGGLLGTIAARIARVPVTIYHIRGLPYMVLSGLQRMLLMTTERMSSKLANIVFSVSHSIADVAVEDGIVPREKIKVFLKGSGNGIDTRDRYNPANVTEAERLLLRDAHGIPADAVVCLFVGRVTADKGIRELVSAWDQVSSTHPQAWLLIVGSQDERLPLDSETLGVLKDSPRVVLAGNQTKTDVYYAASDIVVLPSYREGFPTVLLEAAALGKAAVATRIPGCTDAIVEGETGDLIPVKDSVALADALSALINDPQRREAYGEAARKRVVEYFDSRIIWEATLEEYHRLLAEHSSETQS